MNLNSIYALIKANPSYTNALYSRGFLLTNDRDRTAGMKPFSNWRKETFGKIDLFVHPELSSVSIPCGENREEGGGG